MSLMLEERPAPSRPSAPAPQEVVVRVDQGRRRRRPGVLGALVGLLLAAVVVGGAVLLTQGWSWFGDVFASRTIDRSAPVVVERLRDRASFTGATGTFSATVDVEHKHGFVPTFIAGSRAVYTGVGNADATVDLSRLPTTPTRAADGTLVLRLPHARIGDVHIDARQSHMMNRDRGMLDRLGSMFVDSPTSEREVQQIAERRIARAAAQSDLRARAERNTEAMIREVATSAGAGKVDVRFGAA